jgi:hypothetical protein
MPPKPSPTGCSPAKKLGKCLLAVGFGPIPGPLGLNVIGYAAASSNSLVASRAVVLGAAAFWGTGPIGSTLSLGYAPLVCVARMSNSSSSESPFSYGP